MNSENTDHLIRELSKLLSFQIIKTCQRHGLQENQATAAAKEIIDEVAEFVGNLSTLIEAGRTND